MTFEDWMVWVYQGQHSFKNLDQAFRSAWDAGAAAEREACVQVCAEQAESPALAPLEKYRASFIADAIRARSNT